MARALENYLLQFDISDEPNKISLVSIKLDGSSIQFKSIHPVTASDIYEIITEKALWKNEEEAEDE